MALREGLRVWAEIDLDAVESNVRNLNQQAGDAHLLAVVKGNAYGHGAYPVAKTALAAGAWGVGVIGFEEGEDLRRLGFEGPVLVLGSTAPEAAASMVAAGLRATVGSRELVEALSAAARKLERQAIVHIKVETGLNRYGLVPDEAVALAEYARGLPNVVVEGISTHFASVDEGDKEFTFRQYFAFRDCADRLPWVPLHHVSSTGAIIDLPEIALTMVRTGIGLYGYYPSEQVGRRVPLTPALALRSRVARVQEVEPGASVGYGRAWTATRQSRIATIMAGYGDGVRRVLSNAGIALVRGQRAKFAGRVAMDMVMLDVTDIPEVSAGDEVTLIGRQGEQCISADEVAALSGTISYEVLAGLMARIPRLYIRQGQVVARMDLAGYRETVSG